MKLETPERSYGNLKKGYLI